MAQQVVLAAQLVPRYHIIRRCNNYVVLQSIPCSPECKIVGKILLDHPLSYALTATADVPVVYYVKKKYRDSYAYFAKSGSCLFLSSTKWFIDSGASDHMTDQPKMRLQNARTVICLRRGIGVILLSFISISYFPVTTYHHQEENDDLSYLVRKPSTQLKDVTIDAPNDVSNDAPNDVSNDVPISAPSEARGKSDAPSGSDSPLPSPTPELDLPIALRKGCILLAVYVDDIVITGSDKEIKIIYCVISQFLTAPRTSHWDAVTQILGYLKGDPRLGILYVNHGHHIAEGFTNVDYVGCPTTSHSTMGYCIFVGGNLVSWKSKKQNVVSRSSSEAEYRAMEQTTCELVWLHNCNTLPYANHNIVCFTRRLTVLLYGPYVKTSW
nr:hypothetical protein [Tanacetum cinerariifolium]